MYIRSSYICEMQPQFQNAGTDWRAALHRRTAKRRASTRETVWRWISTATGASSCAQLDGGMNYRNWFRGSRPRIVIGKGSGGRRRVRSPGEGYLVPQSGDPIWLTFEQAG